MRLSIALALVVAAGAVASPAARIVALQSLTRDHDVGRGRAEALDHLVTVAPGIVGSAEASARFAAAAAGDAAAQAALAGTDLAALAEDQEVLAAAREVFGDGELERALGKHAQEAKPYFRARIAATAAATGCLEKKAAGAKGSCPDAVVPAFSVAEEAGWRQRNAVVFAAAVVGLASTNDACRENQAQLRGALQEHLAGGGAEAGGGPTALARVLQAAGRYPKTRAPLCPYDGRALEVGSGGVDCPNHPR